MKRCLAGSTVISSYSVAKVFSVKYDLCVVVATVHAIANSWHSSYIQQS